MRFAYYEQVFEFRALPFGLSTAPRVFTVVITWCIDYLRRQGLNVINYLDDILIAHHNADQLSRDVEFAASWLQLLAGTCPRRVRPLRRKSCNSSVCVSTHLKMNIGYLIRN